MTYIIGPVLLAAILWVLVATPLRRPKIVLKEELLDAVRGSSYSPIATAQRANVNINQHNKSFIIGVNAAVDLVVPAIPFLNALNQTAQEETQDFPLLRSLDDLTRSFGHHFQKGAAAERFFADGTEFSKLVHVARTMPETKAFAGGNAAIMAEYFASRSRYRSHEAMLAAKAGPHIRGLLPPTVTVPDVFRDDNDEYHIIMEYQKGDAWGTLLAPQANRFIFSHDKANAELRAVPPLYRLLKLHSNSTQNPSNEQMIIISGVHMLEGQSSDFQVKRIKQLVKMLDFVPNGTPVHLELASVSDSSLMKNIATNLLPKVDSLGLNEQELAFLVSNLPSKPKGGEESNARILLSQPRLAIEYIKHILGYASQDFGNKNAKLSRIHFHCLTYHLIASEKGHWTSARVSVAAGSIAASQRACEDPFLNVDSFDVVLKQHTTADGTLWPNLTGFTSSEFHSFEFVMVPVLVCKHPSKTVGLGDTISAAGLEYSSFKA